MNRTENRVISATVKKEEEAMATAMLQQEKEAAARQQKEDTVRTMAMKPPHQQPAALQVADTPSIHPQPDAPLLLLSPRHPPPISTPCSPDKSGKKVQEWTPTLPRLQQIQMLSKRILPPPQEENKEIKRKNFIQQIKLLQTQQLWLSS
jgi:hypothetical protein